MKTSTSGDSRCSLKVLILGGYGAMAQSTVPDLLASPGVERIGIAGRSAAKAKSFAAAQRDDRATAVPVDARDSRLNDVEDKTRLLRRAGGVAAVEQLGNVAPAVVRRTLFYASPLAPPIPHRGNIVSGPALSGLDRS